ncbi:MAG: 4-hydroxy-tetrahydrodipicolinate synthase [Proteobacteria bacterium]|jgi:4-hydroxy-tetrahydrodipicolinate synthase|nr:4-hydroxy-tetrahydrodipicolinate synthase [Pseudomonadota bacterium]
MTGGLYTAIITPFSNGKIDYHQLDKIIAFQHENGADGIVLHGTTGEAPTITFDEFVESSHYVLEKWASKLKIIIGISQNSTADILQKQNALKLQPYAFLVTPPSYSKPTQEGIYRHFEAVAKNTSVPIIVYNVPGRTVADVLPETLQRIVETLPNIIAIKDATGSFVRFSQEQFAMKSHKFFFFLTGDDGTSLHFLLSGGHGIVSVVSNIVPSSVKKMITLAQANKKDEAFAVYFEMFNLINLLFVESNPMPVKYAMHKMGLCELEYRLPMCKPSSKLMQEIDAELKKLNII